VDDFAAGGTALAQFNPMAGTLISSGASGGFTIVLAGATQDALATGLSGNGWLRYFITFTTSAAITNEVTIANMNASNSINYTGNNTSNIIIWGAQLEDGTLSDYHVSTIVTQNECTRYVKYNTVERLWDAGIMPRGGFRTAFLDYNVFGKPLGADQNFRIQKHETGFDDDEVAMEGAFVESGYGFMNDGDDIWKVSHIIPDFKWFGDEGAVNVTIKGVQYPHQRLPVIVGPTACTDETEYFEARIRARQLAIKYEWLARRNTSARIGAVRVMAEQAGKRP